MATITAAAETAAPDYWEPSAAPLLPQRPTDRPLLDKASEQLRAAYIELMRRRHAERNPGTNYAPYNSHARWDGGVDAATKRRYKTPIWPKIVQDAKKHNCDPLELVLVLFKHWQGQANPTPFAITDPINIERCLRQSSDTVVALAETLKSEYAVFVSAVWSAAQSIPDAQAAERFALNDVGRAMSPLFRYATAKLKQYDDVAVRWRHAANAQFARHPVDYIDTWSAILPDEFLPIKLADART